MNLLNILEAGDQQMPPLAVLVAYNNYIEIASVQNKEIGAMSPLTKEALQKIVTLSMGDTSVKKIGGLVPTNVVFTSFSIADVIVVFKIKAHKRTIFITDDSVEVNVPNLLMKVTNDKLNVYAYKGGLKDNTKLFKAPFSNFTGNDEVCFGTIKIKKSLVISEIIDNFTNAYWNSQFEMNKEKALTLIANNWNKSNFELTFKELIERI